jgi:phosphopantothenoylcysteine synthetase/decarboxylase
MRIFVTAGNTQVAIDRVRSITNIFTGRTGAAIALEAHRRGHEVALATSHPDTVAHLGTLAERWRCQTYVIFHDLQSVMEGEIRVALPDAVIHCAAVSDYLPAGVFAPAADCRFDPAAAKWLGSCDMLERRAAKVKSDDPELWLRLVRAPKLADKVRGAWGFHGIFVKFKLEVNVSDADLLAVAEASRRQSQADWMVANTLEGAKDWAYLGSAAGYEKVLRAELAGAVLDAIERQHHG